jgi:hypothetical protein
MWCNVLDKITLLSTLLEINIMIKWSTVLLPIREVPGSNLGPETGYHDRGFSWFPQSLQANAGIVP